MICLVNELLRGAIMVAMYIDLDSANELNTRILPARERLLNFHTCRQFRNILTRSRKLCFEAMNES